MALPWKPSVDLDVAYLRLNPFRDVLVLDSGVNSKAQSSANIIYYINKAYCLNVVEMFLKLIHII